MTCARLILGLTIFLQAMAAHAEPPSAQDLAKYLDRVRRPERPFEMHLTVTERRSGKTPETSEYHVFARKTGRGHGFDTLTRCLAPEADAGKVLLTRDNELWLFDPKSDKPVRVPPQRLRAKSWDFDALSSSFAAEYDAELLGEETVQDASRTERRCIHLKLTIHDRSAPMPGIIDYWLDRTTRLPVQARFQNAGGKLLRTTYYADFGEVLGVSRPRRAFVISATERGLVEELRFTQFAHRGVPESLFVPGALREVSAGRMP